MNKIITDLKKAFDSFFHSNKNEFHLFFAPGRVNLIGEHTDYNGGLVLPIGLDIGTYILAKKNNSSIINLASLNFNQALESIDLKKYLQKENKWTDYIKGVLVELKKTGNNFQQGFDCIVFGNIPNGAGLSSSASIEMASIITLLFINDLEIPKPGSIDMVNMTLLAQKSENNFIGVNCGIMDQFIVGNAKADFGILLDCYDLSFKFCNVNLGEYALLIANTNKKRRLEDSLYNKRRAECDEGFLLLKQLGIKSPVLSRVTLEEWENIKSKINNTIIQKRLNHVITENERVRRAYKSLSEKDISGFANLLNESGDSLQHDYEVTGVHLDALVEAARKTDGVIASRMTGAGFGGCTINIVKNELIDQIISKIDIEYSKKTDLKPDFYEVKIGNGARKIELN